MFSRGSSSYDEYPSSYEKSHYSHASSLTLPFSPHGLERNSYIQRAGYLRKASSAVQVKHRPMIVPVDLETPHFLSLSHPTKVHVAGHMDSHRELIAKAQSRIDTRAPIAMQWSIRKTESRIRDPLPGLKAPLTIKNHSTREKLEHIKRQHKVHNQLISKSRAYIKTRHSDQHILAHMKKEKRRKKRDAILRKRSKRRFTHQRSLRGETRAFGSVERKETRPKIRRRKLRRAKTHNTCQSTKMPNLVASAQRGGVYHPVNPRATTAPSQAFISSASLRSGLGQNLPRIEESTLQRTENTGKAGLPLDMALKSGKGKMLEVDMMLKKFQKMGSGEQEYLLRTLFKEATSSFGTSPS